MANLEYGVKTEMIKRRKKEEKRVLMPDLVLLSCLCVSGLVPIFSLVISLLFFKIQMFNFNEVANVSISVQV